MEDSQQNFKSKIKRSQGRDSFQDHGKLPPQAVDLEEAVLGALMLERDAIVTVSDKLFPEVFYKESHQAIFQAIISMYDLNENIDILTVTNKLRKLGKLELAGGPFYITQLTSRIASSANVEFHAGILKQKYMQRELIRISTNAIRDSFEDTTDVFDLLDETENQLYSISEKTISGKSCHISVASSAAMKEIATIQALAARNEILGVTTGLTELDKITGGWQKSELIVVAGRPGMGKTAFMLHCAKAASQRNNWLNIYSLEMDETKLARRLILSECNINPSVIKDGNLSPGDWVELHESEKRVNEMNILIDPTPNASMRYIRSRSKVNKRKGQCDMIMIDYLQLIEPSGKDKLREQQVADISRTCKIMAKELEVPVILLAQLNREVEKEKEKKPQLSHLRESGAVEQDADMVLFIYRPEYYGILEDSKGNDLRGVGKIIIAKYREGANTEVKFKYNPSLTHITDFVKPENQFEHPYNSNQFPSNPNF